jgi:hypothetical protein
VGRCAFAFGVVFFDRGVVDFGRADVVRVSLATRRRFFGAMSSWLAPDAGSLILGSECMCVDLK